MYQVESFNRCLPDFDGVLQSGELVERIEMALLASLESPVRLLRWAVVRVEEGRFWCEGAYLKAE